MDMLMLAKALRPWGIVLGAAVTGLTLVGHLDDLLVKHLDAVFATKADVAKVEEKVDTILRKLDEVSASKGHR